MAMRPAPEMYGYTQRYRENATIYNQGSMHGAVDIGVPMNTPLLAPEDGVVVFDGWAWDLPGGPWDYHLRWYLIKPDVGNTTLGAGIITIFRNAVGSHWGIAHANKSYFFVGDRIKKGQVIQLSGTSGSSTGPHTHINLWPAHPSWNNGAFGAIDPEPWLYEPYSPLRYVSWQGGQTEGTGEAVRTEPKSTLEEIMALDRGSAEYKAVINDIAKAVLDHPIARQGSDPDGKPYVGNTTLAMEASWGTFRGFRARRLEQGITEILSTLKSIVSTNR